MKQNYRSLFSQKEYLKVICANFMNRLGDTVDMMAFSWITFTLTKSASWSALVLGFNFLPNIFIQPFAGAIVEKFNKKSVIISCDILRGLMTFLIAGIYLSHSLKPWMLLVITFLNNTFEAFRTPASTAIIPYILDDKLYEYGTAFNGTISRICELAGTALFGVIVGMGGIGSAIFMDAVTFFICASIFLTVHMQEKKRISKWNLSSYITSLKEGFAYVKSNPLFISLILIGIVLNALLVPFNSFQSAYISGVLHQDTNLYTIATMIFAIALGSGSFVYPFLHKKFSNRCLLLFFSSFLGIYYASMYPISLLNHTFFIYFALCCAYTIFGFGIGIVMTISNSCIIKIIDPSYLARASSVMGALCTCAMPVTSFILTVLTLYVELTTLFTIFALFTFFVLIGMIFLKNLRQL